MKEKYCKIFKLMGLISIISIGVIISLSAIFFPDVFENKDSILYYYRPDVLVGLLSIIIFINPLIDLLSKRENNNEIYYDEINEKLIANSTTDNKDILGLMLTNMKEIREYYAMSKKMAKYAFALSIVMSIGGFCILAYSTIYVLVNNLSLIHSILPVISGAIMEIIASTAMLVYKKSLEKLDKYYNSLHENEILLSVINIASKISVEKRDDTYNYIIKAKLENQKSTYN